MTNQLSLISDDAADDAAKPIKKRGPYKKRIAPPKPEKAMAKLELKTALLDGLFETAHTGPEKRFNAKEGDQPAVLNKNHPSRLHLKEIRGIYDYKDGATGEVFADAIVLRVKAPVLMGIQAETILLSLLHLAGKQELLSPITPLTIEAVNTVEQSQLPSLATGGAKNKPKGEIKTTKSELLRIAAMGDGKRAYDLLDACLEQMSDMRVHYENKQTGWKGGDNFLRYLSHKDGRLNVEFNWRLSGVFLGEYYYANIDLNERNFLKRDNTKTLHRWLSGHIWEGKSRTLKYSSLAAHVWTTETTELAQKKREQRVRLDLLKEINELDCWSVEFLKDTAKITRFAKAKSRDAQV
jgi:hypothetical protein